MVTQAQRCLHHFANWLVLCVLLVLAAISSVASAEVRATVSPNPAPPGVPVELSITVTGANQANPEFSVLENSFRIARQQQSSQINIINGQTTRTISWVLQLLPKKDGPITIPPITVGQQQSQPLVLRIEKPDPNAAANQELFLESEVDNANPYVGEQVLYKLRLFYARGLAEGSLPPPQPQNAVVEQLGNAIEYEENRDGTRYSVMEWKYVIFAEQSGSIEVPGPIFSGKMIVERGGFGRMFQQTRPAYTSAPDLVLQVKPAANASQPWLPAEDVRLNAVWTGGQPQMRVGEPVTRQIDLRVVGQLHTQLSEQLLQITGGADFQIYAEPSQAETSGSSNAVVAQRSQQFAIIPNRPGKLTLPAVTLEWWNTKTNRAETARIPAASFEVAPAPLRQSQAPLAPTDDADEPLINSRPAAVDATEQSSSSHWRPLAITFAILWLLSSGLCCWLWQQSREKKTAAKFTRSEATAGTENIAIKAVRQAAKANDALTTKAALQQWVHARWPQLQPGQTLNSQLQQADNKEFKQAYAELNSQLYAANGKASDWNGTALLAAFNELLNELASKKETAKAAALPELYAKR